MADIWKQCINSKEEYNCGNPKDNTILALTTKLAHLESKLMENQPNGGCGGREGASGSSRGGNGRDGRNGSSSSNDPLKWCTKTEGKITCNSQDW
eukprot:1880485-Ditylum_brightwellii.AAC.1